MKNLLGESGCFADVWKGDTTQISRYTMNLERPHRPGNSASTKRKKPISYISQLLRFHPNKSGLFLCLSDCLIIMQYFSTFSCWCRVYQMKDWLIGGKWVFLFGGGDTTQFSCTPRPWKGPTDLEKSWNLSLTKAAESCMIPFHNCCATNVSSKQIGGFQALSQTLPKDFEFFESFRRNLFIVFLKSFSNFGFSSLFQKLVFKASAKLSSIILKIYKDFF